ncbi:MAG: hypothetical protein ACOZCF_10435 [Bacillota bacterium]
MNRAISTVDRTFDVGWCSFVLLNCGSHADFREFLLNKLSHLAVLESSALAKLWVLDLDPAIPLLMSCYSSLGRPAD